MSLVFAAAPGLAIIGLAMLVIGFLALTLLPAARREVGRVLVTGVIVTAIGGLPALMGGMQGAAHADGSTTAKPVQQMMLSGMGSQIIYN